MPAVAVLFLLVAATPGFAASPTAYCRRVGTDDRARPIPSSLVPDAIRLFHLHPRSRDWVARSTLYRCDRHRVLLCNLGANLPCGKADARRHLAGADRWCAAHRDSDFIPAYVAGHGSLYRWRCAGARAVTAGVAFHRDRRGFVAEMWRPLPPP